MEFKVHHFLKHVRTSLRNRGGSCLLGKILGQLGIFLYPSGGGAGRKENLLQITPDPKFHL